MRGRCRQEEGEDRASQHRAERGEVALRCPFVSLGKVGAKQLAKTCSSYLISSDLKACHGDLAPRDAVFRLRAAQRVQLGVVEQAAVERGAWMVKGGGIGNFGGRVARASEAVASPTQWLGLALGVPSCTEPPDAP